MIFRMYSQGVGRSLGISNLLKSPLGRNCGNLPSLPLKHPYWGHASSSSGLRPQRHLPRFHAPSQRRAPTKEQEAKGGKPPDLSAPPEGLG